MEILGDGRVTVVETFNITYLHSTAGMSRNLPFSVQTNNQDARLVRIRNLRAWNAEGNPVLVQRSGQFGDFGEYEFDGNGTRAEPGEQRTYTIAYEAAGTVVFSERGGSRRAHFVWPLVGHWRQKSIESLTWQIEFPEQQPSDPITAHFITHSRGAFARDRMDGVGSQRGEGTGADLLLSYGFFEGDLKQGLEPYNGALVSLQLPGYLFAESERSVFGLVFAWRNLVLILPLVAAISLYLYWRRFGRDEQARHVAISGDVLDGVSPAETGVLRRGRAHRDDLAAALANLMVQGFLVVNWTELKPFHQRPKAMFTLVLTKDGSAHGVVEQRLLKLLKDAKQTRFSEKEIRQTIAPNIPTLKRELYQELVRKGFLRDSPGETMSRVNFVGFLSLTALIGGLGMARLWPAWHWLLFSVVATEMVVIFFSRRMTMRTAKGVLAH
jgi:hypothetical protein